MKTALRLNNLVILIAGTLLFSRVTKRRNSGMTGLPSTRSSAVISLFQHGITTNDSMCRDGSERRLRGISKYSGDARSVFVHPSQISLSLRESCVGDRFADSANRIKLKGFFLTDFYAQKDLFKKRVLASFSVMNIFDKRYETFAHPFSWYEGPLQARGRTFALRGEYRF